MSFRKRLAKALIMASKDGVFTLDAIKAASGVGDSLVNDFINLLINEGVLVRVGDGYRSTMPPHRLIRYFMGKGVNIDLESMSRYLPGMSLRLS